jgi:hypothetical protein
VWIQPGETFRYACDFTVYQPEPFSAELLLHLEDHDIRTITLSVRGDGIQAGVKAAEQSTAP